jgi:hypothetical protein
MPRGWLTPDSATGECKISLVIPNSTEWRALFFGALTELSYSYNWEKYGVMTPEEAAEAADKAIREAIRCEDENLITGVRITGCDIEIEQNGEWSSIGSPLDNLVLSAVGLPSGDPPTAVIDGCDLELGIPQGQQGIQGLTGETGQNGLDGADGLDGQVGASGTPGYGLPLPTDEDAICFMATQLAIYVQDDVQDFLEALDFTQTAFLGSIKDLFRAVASFIPTFVGFGIDEAASWIFDVTYNVTEAALDYARENVADIEVRDIFANWVYCALKESLVVDSGNVSLVNFPANLAAQAGGAIISLPVNVSGDTITMTLGTILNGLLNATNTALAGYTAGWFIAQEYVIGEIFGVEDGYRTLLATAYGGAQYFDSRSCASFESCEDITPGCYIMGQTQTQVVFTTINGTGSGFERTASGGLLTIDVILPEPRTVTTFKFKTKHVGAASVDTINAEMYNGVTMVRDLLTYSRGDGAYAYYEWCCGGGMANTNNTVADRIRITITTTAERVSIKDIEICFT